MLNMRVHKVPIIRSAYHLDIIFNRKPFTSNQFTDLVTVTEFGHRDQSSVPSCKD